MPKEVCRACQIAAMPPPRPEYPYLAALCDAQVGKLVEERKGLS